MNKSEQKRNLLVYSPDSHSGNPGQGQSHEHELQGDRTEFQIPRCLPGALQESSRLEWRHTSIVSTGNMIEHP